VRVSIPTEALSDAYRLMKTIREFEERVNAEIMNGQIPGFTHLYTGQEANAVGVCAHLDTDDTIISTHRGHGHCIAKGADVSGMMKELFGSSEGLCKGKGGSMALLRVVRRFQSVRHWRQKYAKTARSRSLFREMDR
jgi:TPP-dependent pyruvate/acetoin dehydrogenase alpha subunit